LVAVKSFCHTKTPGGVDLELVISVGLHSARVAQALHCTSAPGW